MGAASLFWLVALLLVGISVAALVWPLLRNRARSVESEDVATTDVYRDQKRQLDAEWASGVISREERDAGLDELALRLGAELSSGSAATSAASARPSYIAAVVLAAALPVTALALYAAFGNPSALRAGAAAPATANSSAPKSHDEIVAVVESLARRMKEHPEDPKGWRLLGRAYSSMGRFGEAVAAFQEAAKRGGEDATLLADWADALAMQTKSLEGEPSALIARALALDPNDEKALSLAASAAFYRRDFDGAIAKWRALQSLYPAGSDEAKEVGSLIAEAEAGKRGGESANAATTSPPVAATPSPPVPAASASAVSAITGNVSLDPKLRDNASPNDTLFIYARAAQGPRMPLAIVRASAKDLPRAFTLDDSMAMTPANRLSNAADVVVEARISKSGNAIAAPGDLVGTSGAVKPGSRDVSIVINDVVR